MKITFKGVQEKSRKKNYNSSNNLHWFSSRLSIYFTFLFVKMQFTADRVTSLFFLTGLIGSFLYVSTAPLVTFIGYLCFRLHIILDLSDGEVARFNNSYSIKGAYWDAMIHSVLNPLYVLFICFSYYQMFQNNIFLIISPVMTLIFSLTLAVKHNYFKALYVNGKTEGPRSKKLYKSLKAKFIYVFSEIISIEGLVLTNIFVKILGSEVLALYSLVFYLFFNLLLVTFKFYLFSFANMTYSKT
jgi:phosphatidylglycerophosphate synthase